MSRLTRNEKILLVLKTKLSHQRFEHTLGVAAVAEELALAHGVHVENAVTAALLHDIAREMPQDELWELCVQQRLFVEQMDIEFPMLMHSLVAAWIAQSTFSVQEQEILEAIRYHTTAGPAMGDLSKIIYIADMIEPGRGLPRSSTIQKLAQENLDRAVLQCIEETLDYLMKKGERIHPLTYKAKEYYQYCSKE